MVRQALRGNCPGNLITLSTYTHTYFFIIGSSMHQFENIVNMFVIVTQQVPKSNVRAKKEAISLLRQPH